MVIPDYRDFQHSNELYHHGIRGQKWGVRNGPPYPLKGGEYKQLKEKKYKRTKRKYSLSNKKHFDSTLDKSKIKLSTLSYDKDRTKNTDMFYSTYTKRDKHLYGALFNKKIPQTLYDEKGNAIGTGSFAKYRIKNKLKTNMKVASEDSGAKIFMDLYKKDRDFYNFVTDKDRMSEYFVKDKYKFKGYREGKEILDKIRSENYNPTSEDLKKVYRLFNYVLPYDGAGNERNGKDVTTQRAKFFKKLGDQGYGAVLDTNDAIYGGFKSDAPIIVFDMKQIIPDETYRTTLTEINMDRGLLLFNKIFK